MAKRACTTGRKREEKKGYKARTASRQKAGGGSGAITWLERPSEPLAAAGDVTVQAARLGDRGLQNAQRQSLATEIGRRQGNQHLQRAVASLKQDTSTDHSYPGVSSTVIQRSPDPLSPDAENLKAQILGIIHGARTPGGRRRGLTSEERQRIMDLLGEASDDIKGELDGNVEFKSEITRRLHRAVYRPILRELERATRRGRLARFSVRYNVPLVPQISICSCWAAAAAMVVSWNMGLSGRPALNVREIAEEAGLTQVLHRPEGMVISGNVYQLASAWGLTVEPAGSYSVRALYDMFAAHGPLWLTELSSGDGVHALVISGMVGDGSAEGTQLQVHDPWPPRVGRVRFMSFAELLGGRERLAAEGAPEAALSILHG